MSRLTSLDASRYAIPRDVVQRVLTPALVVHLPTLRQNVRTVLERVGRPERWRPHVKTLKLEAAMRELVRAGVRQFKCATTLEAAVLARVLGGTRADVLVAHPATGPALDRLATLAGEHPRLELAVLVDTPQGVEHVPSPLAVFVDVNVGMDRTGIPIDDERAIERTARAAGGRYRGLHAYEGHLVDFDRSARRRAAFEVFDRLAALVGRLAGSGLRPPALVTSGSPTFDAAIDHRGLAELGATAHAVSPGTVAYHDARTEEQSPHLGLTPAALVLSTLVSRPRAGVVTLDAGSKSLAAEAGDPCALVVGRPAWTARPPSEEHLPCDVPPGAADRPGERFLLIPRHVCPTVNLARRALLLDDGCAPRETAVDAGGHELAV